MKESCPGSKEIRNPFPEEMRCYFCDAPVEIWSDETETACKHCGHEISRDLKASCLMWCPAAKECVGLEKYERIMKHIRE